jgi:hypothetical protein
VFLSLGTKCNNDPESISDNKDLDNSEEARYLSNDSIFYLGENLVPIADIYHFDVNCNQIVYGIGNYIVMHDTDFSMQVGYIEIDHKKMDLVYDNLYYKKSPFKDIYAVNTKYIHDQYNISFDAMKTINHRINDLYIDDDKIEAFVFMSLYLEMQNGKLSGSNIPTILTYGLVSKTVNANTTRYNFLDDNTYFEPHYLLLGTPNKDNLYAHSWDYNSRSKADYSYPILYSLLDSKGYLEKVIVYRDSNNYNIKTKQSFNEWHEYDFEDDQYYLTTSFNDRIFTKHGDIIIYTDSNNNYFRKAFLDMGDNERKEYYNSQPYNYFINEIEVENNILKLLMTVPGVNTDNYLIQTYDVNGKKMIKQKYVDMEKFINVKFSKDLKHLYTLHLDEKADMYYIKKTEI